MLLLKSKIIPDRWFQEQAEPRITPHLWLQEQSIQINHQMWHQIKDIKNLVKIYPLRKDPIHRRKESEPHGSKTLNTESDNYFTECSHDEENIENKIFMDELSNEDKEDAKDS